MSDNFEQAYRAFLNEQAYDESATIFFPIERVAFKAGWLAAGGQVPTSDASTPDTYCNRQI